MPKLSTFSIAAYDPTTESWGVAVQSKFLAAAAVVSHAQAGAGAVATQSYANARFGPLGLHMMRAGMSAEQTIDSLVAGDPDRGLRQVGVVDKEGRAAAFTGDKCYDWAGHYVGEGFCCQGNILASEQVVADMAAAFESSASPFALRLIEALEAGQQAGGDRRGRQAAGLLVVREGAGYGGFSDIAIDLRVDDHDAPIRRLRELYDMHDLYFGESDPDDLVSLDDDTVRELLRIAQNAGTYQGDISGDLNETTLNALEALMGTENLEMRWNPDEESIDRQALEFLRARYGT